MSTEKRWGHNAALFVVSIGLSGLVLRLSPIAVAVAVSGSHSGVLQQWEIPVSARCVIAILALDLVSYAVHRLSHSVMLLWRFHEIHHSDPDFDVSTAVRFHPLEVFLTQSALLLAIYVLGPPILAVVISELLGMTVNLMVHANIEMNPVVERWFGFVFVTPTQHRTHHSEDRIDQNTNFGQTFSLWDRMFGSFASEPRLGGVLKTGVIGLQNESSVPVARLLLRPFQTKKSRLTSIEEIHEQAERLRG